MHASACSDEQLIEPMTNSKQDRIALQAAQWVVKFDGPFEPRDVYAFRRWIARSDAHRAAFVLSSQVWNKLDLLSKLEAYPLPPPVPRPALSRRALLAGSGVVALGVGAVSFLALAPETAEAIETGIGEHRDVVLDDGTRVILNAASRLETRTGRRQVRLVAGEALFEIGNRPARGAFSIITDHGQINATRGAILVKLFPHGLRVAVLQGAAQASRREGFGPLQHVPISASSEAVFAANSVQVTTTAPDVLERRTLWREGMLAFDDTPLAEAAADVSRQNGVRFVFEDAALADRRVGGLIRAGDLDAFLSLLSDNLSIRAEREGQIIRLSAD
jgi:transmembrane sensor